jgi:hypothetical protein
VPIVRGAWAELLAPGLNMNTFNSYREFPEFYRRIVNVKDSRKAYEDDFRISALGPLARKGELETTILDEPIKIGGIRYIHKTFALGIAISQEMRDDNQYGPALQLAGMLGRSSRLTTELYGHDVYNNGFTTAKYVGRDGKALFAVDHPIQGTGGIMSNRPAVGLVLAQAALETAIGAFDAQVDERGMPVVFKAKYLVVPPPLRFLAYRLIYSAGLPGTPNNDVNPVLREGLEIISDPWIIDQDSWYLLSEQQYLDVNFWWREMPDTKTWDDDNADATFHKIRQRHSTGFGDWRGTWGSIGA